MMNEMKSEPSYYGSNGLSPLGAFQRGLLSEEEYKGFLKGNIIKYVIRADKKGFPVQDLNKAKDYINLYMNLFKMTSEEQEKLNQELISTCQKGIVERDTSNDKYDDKYVKLGEVMKE